MNDNGYKRIEQIGEMLAKPPSTDYDQLTRDLTQLYQAIRWEIAARLESALKAKIQSIPNSTYEEKKLFQNGLMEN